MVEAGVSQADKTEFTECWKTSWRTPYIMKLAFSAGLGGLLFGYDTGVISGALLYIKEDFPSVEKKTWMQETIVSMAVAGAIIGAAIGGWMNDRIRGALVSTNGFLITGGQFLSYLINLAFTHVNGTWRYMLGVAGLPAVIQFILMLSLPESPRWLFRNGKEEEAKSILEKIYRPEEVEDELQSLRASIEEEKKEQVAEGGFFGQLKNAWKNDVVRRALYAGITVQVAQQFVGINTVMYYSPTIIQFAGFASNKTAMALSLITSGLNAIGSIVSMCFVDRYGRRRLMIISMIGIISCLVVLSIIFFQASITAPKISPTETAFFGGNSTCEAYTKANDAAAWGCTRCLQKEAGCGYCSAGGGIYQPGACLAINDGVKGACRAAKRTWYTEGCPSKIGFLAVIFLALYIIIYSPGMGTVPWIVNSEIYPLKYRGIGGGIAAVANWSSNLVVSETFLTLTDHLGSSGTFLLFAGFSLIGLVSIFLLVPETKGLQFSEVEKLLEKGYSPFKKSSKKVKKEKDGHSS
ncbi:UNVERIFIED_CONTAM: Inositol transporter 4 [Sesamum calycinum]|uniref:Inositol transporter 4 n=1 Tax=Sesamum calycinum TaxID=2727403 RepID=A0AAW2MKS5_9LAMI